jgi:hypothetical protein
MIFRNSTLLYFHLVLLLYVSARAISFFSKYGVFAILFEPDKRRVMKWRELESYDLGFPVSEFFLRNPAFARKIVCDSRPHFARTPRGWS